MTAARARMLRAELSSNGRTGRKVFWAALIFEIAFLFGACFFSNFSAPENTLQFTGLLVLAGISYLTAVRHFPKLPPEHRGKLLWIAAVFLRMLVVLCWEIPADSTNHFLFPGGDFLFRILGQISCEPLFTKFFFAVCDLVTIYFLVRINTGFERYRVSAWYAWNPAVIVAFSGFAFSGCFMVMTLTGAIWALHRANPLGLRKPVWSWSLLSVALLGLSIAFIPVGLFLIPVWCITLKRKSWIAMIALLIPSTFLWMADTVSSFQPSYMGGMILFSILVAVIFRNDWKKATLWILGVVVLFFAIVSQQPWYIVWILPLACWRRQFAWFIFSISALFGLLWSMEMPKNLDGILVAVILLPAVAAWGHYHRKAGIALQ